MVAKPKKKRPKGQAKATLLNSALQLLSEKGAYNVSLHDVAAHARLNVALVRYHFGSKEMLLGAVLAHIAEDWESRLAAVEDVEATSVDALRARIAVTTRLLYDYPYFTRLLIMLMADQSSTEVSEFVERFALKSFKAQSLLLQKGTSRNEFRKVDHRLFFLTYVGMTDFFFMAGPFRERILGTRMFDEALIPLLSDHLSDLILYGIVPRKASSPRPRKRE